MSYDRSYFEESNYKNYTKGWYRFTHWVKFLWLGMWLRMFGVKRVLDFGCADGVSVAAFRILGIEAWGCDLSKYAISKAPLIAKDYLWVGQVYDKKFSNNYFDYVVSFDVLEHVSPKQLCRVVKYLAKVARKGVLGIYVKDEIVARIHKKINKKHPDHLSEHDSYWWRKYFAKKEYKVKHLPFSRKGSFWVDFV